MKYTYAHLCNYKEKYAKCTPIDSTVSAMNNGITWNKKDLVFIADPVLSIINIFKISKTVNSYDLQLI